MFFRSHDASIPEKKLNAYEDIWVKCEVGPKNPHIFFLRQQKKEKTLKEPPSKILKRVSEGKWLYSKLKHIMKL